MKKLKLKALELGAKEILTREQLKFVFGGSGDDGSGVTSGTCCAHYSQAPGNDEWCCGLSKADAQNTASKMGDDGNWCCDSCVGHASQGCTY